MGLVAPRQWDLYVLGTEPMFPVLAGRCFTAEPPPMNYEPPETRPHYVSEQGPEPHKGYLTVNRTQVSDAQIIAGPEMIF